MNAKSMSRRGWLYLLAGFGVVGASAYAQVRAGSAAGGGGASGAPVAVQTPRGRLQAAPPVTCAATTGGSAAPTVQGNPAARRAAQSALGFVARDAIAWQHQHNCYGCHVQAVTLEALSVGRHNQYTVPQSDLDEVVRGLTTISGGSRGPSGLSVGGSPSHLIETSRVFGGAAFARYDQFLDANLRDDLLSTATNILSIQNPDGSVRTTDSRFPVVNGLIQSTTQALQTWRESYARTADERWLAPMRRAEQWLHTRAAQILEDRTATTVDLNYAVLGLLAAGAQGGEPVVQALGRRLRERQSTDGGWGFRLNESSVAFATGQTLYALRSMGVADGDPALDRGTAWLLGHQAEDGGWSHSGSGRAEAMWAVLGLVSIDVLSVNVTGLADGAHLDGTVNVAGSAVDNSHQPVSRVEVLVDDVPVARACGARASYALDTAMLEAGVHDIDVVAYNTQGRSSRRRYEVYTGAYYLTGVGTRFADNGTLLSWRNVAPASVPGQVRVRIFSTRDDHGQPVREGQVFEQTQAAREGAMSVQWNGRGTNNATLPRGSYIAELTFLGANGAPVQTVERPFTHESDEVLQRTTGQIAGSAASNGQAMANARVELVDQQGRVVQSAMTTEQGNYQFSGVRQGAYRVRVTRQGFRSMEAPAAAAPAARSSVGGFDMHLQ